MAATANERYQGRISWEEPRRTAWGVQRGGRRPQAAVAAGGPPVKYGPAHKNPRWVPFESSSNHIIY
jgi:hypothetical protein